MRHPRSREPTPALRRNATGVQKHHRVTGRHRNDIGPFMRQYARNNDIMSTPRRMLVGSYHGEKILLATPLLQWYLAHGLVVEHVYQIIEYQPNPCFRRFGESVLTARREGDSDPNKTIVADTMKLLGNSGYGKTVRDVIEMSSIVQTSEHRCLSTTDVSINSTSSSTMPTRSRWKRKSSNTHSPIT